jgi:hypothetical protein
LTSYTGGAEDAGMIALLLSMALSAEPAKVAAPPPQAKAAAAWLKTLRAADPQKTIILDAAIDPKVPDKLLIMVGPAWAGLAKGQRLDLATGFWQAWSTENKANQPTPDRCRISLMSPTGRPLGGSSAWGGSLIDVDD